MKNNIDIDAILGADNTWPLKDVLSCLVSASERLLNRYNYDGHSYEEIQLCVARGKEILQLFEPKNIIENNIPTGEDVSEPLRNKIIDLLNKHAGANNPSKYNYTMITAVVMTKEFTNYFVDNFTKLFGKYDYEGNRYFYPLCMYAYYCNSNPNSYMFKLKDDKNANNQLPTEFDVMSWFYNKHKDELIGLV